MTEMPRKKMKYPKNRRSPVAHKVKGYTDKNGRRVRGYKRGKRKKKRR